jgi:prevent-host-death family protein
MPSVSAIKFQRRFRHVLALAQRETVVVTNRGDDDVVVMSKMRYRNLLTHQRVASRAADMPDADFAVIERAAAPEGNRRFDHELD